MPVPRSSFTALELLDGRVFIADDDGCNGMSALSGPPQQPGPVDILDPGTGRWDLVAPAGGPRSAFAAVRLDDGRVLIAGGDNGWSGAYSSTKLFLPDGGAWTAGPLMGTARDGPVGALLPDGRVLVAGGTYSAGFRDEADFLDRQASGTWPAEMELTSTEIYDPATERWTASAELPTTITGAQAFPRPDGSILVVTPRDPGRALALLFEPASGSWTAVGSLMWPDGSAAVILDDGSLLVIGGTDAEVRSVATVRRFDPGTRRTTQLAPLPAPRSGAVAARLLDGRVLVAGGYALDGEVGPGSPGNSTAFIYDAARDIWASTAPMPFADSPGQALTLGDGSVLVTGGSIPYEEEVMDACGPNAVGWTAIFTLDPASPGR